MYKEWINSEIIKENYSISFSSKDNINIKKEN